MMMMCPQCCYCPGFVIHTVKNDKMTLPTFRLFLLPPQWKADTSACRTGSEQNSEQPTVKLKELKEN